MLIMHPGTTVVHCQLSTSFLSPVQDALFFLKDFFSNLASAVNPYLPVDPAAEGELCLMMFAFFAGFVDWSRTQ